jgi:D-alanyl-D-alanine-carboxypeptidase/D-alanyl-D-alanine-endopeptidase
LIARALSAAAFFLFASLAPALAASQPPPSDAEVLQMMAARVDLQKQGTGIVFGIARPDGDRILSYGTLGLTDKRRMDGRTVFDVGSISKVLTALLLTDMAQHHEVAIDDPVAKYLPGVSIPSRDGRTITLADPATHTAGLPLRPSNLTSQNPADPYAGYTRDDLFRFLSSYKLPHTPGTTYDYSNVGFGLLGVTLAERAKENFADLAAARITAPLGMSDTRIVPTDDMTKRAAIGYDGDRNPVPHWDMGVLSSAGGYRSTADDLLKLVDAFLGFRKSPLFPAMNAMTKTRRAGGMEPATAIALAWNIYDDNGREIVWKNGSVGGYRTFVGFDRATRTGVVALINAQTGNGADDIGLHYLDPSVTVDLEIPRTHTEIALDTATLDQFVGHYRYSATDMISVIRQGDHLYVVTAPGQPPLEIFAETANGFFFKVANAQLRFEAMKDGHATKAIWHQSGTDQIGARAP